MTRANMADTGLACSVESTCAGGSLQWKAEHGLGVQSPSVTERDTF
jgi:hypothetical protein